MVGFGHVLIAMSLCDKSQPALDLGLYLAERDGARCTLGHVIAKIENPLARTGAGWASTAARQRAAEQAMSVLGSQLHKRGQRGQAAGRVLRFGHTPTGVAEIARDERCDVLVLGSRAETATSPMLTEAIAESSPVPTWIVRPSPSGPIRHVAVGLDFSPPSEAALFLAWNRAQREGARLSVVCAYPSPADFLEGVGWNCRPHYEAECRERLDGLLATLPADSGEVDMELVIDWGPPGAVLCTFAKERAVDLMVIGRSGVHRGPHPYFVGSTARLVLRHAESSVLLAPAS